MEVFRICTLLSLVGMVFFTEGLARSYGGGVGDVDFGFPEPTTECGEGWGVTNISVNFGTQKIFPAYAGWIAPSPWKIAIRTR